MAIKIFSHSRNNIFTAKGVYLSFRLEYTFARWKKYSSKLDISRSLVRNLRQTRIYFRSLKEIFK